MMMMDVFIMETLEATRERDLYDVMVKQVALWKCNF
jgi:hypothetical protein